MFEIDPNLRSGRQGDGHQLVRMADAEFDAGKQRPSLRGIGESEAFPGPAQIIAEALTQKRPSQDKTGPIFRKTEPRGPFPVGFAQVNLPLRFDLLREPGYPHNDRFHEPRG